MQTEPQDNFTKHNPEFDAAGGATLLTLFFGLSKTLRLVGDNNDTFKNQLAKFWERFDSVCQNSRTLTIKIIDGRLFINEQLCRSALKSDVVKEAINRWKSVGISGIEIQYRPNTQDLAKLLQILNKTTSADDAESISQSLIDAKVTGFKLLSEDETDEDELITEEQRLTMRRQARSMFFRSIRTLGEATSQALSGREVSLRQTKRVVHSLVDNLMNEDSALLELTAIKDFDDYTFAHSVNVCIYSLTIGVNLNLDHQRLSQLGFAALFHDIGKIKLPSDIIKSSGTLNDEDWVMIRRHPWFGAKMLLRNFPVETHTIRGALVAFEHHLNMDGTGYPKRETPRDLNLFSRIVTIADTYDALTSGRIYIKKQIPPTEVLRKMLYQMEKKFDKLLLKIFVNSIGLFPAGSLVLLSDKQIAIVENGVSGNPDTPLVRVIGDISGFREVAKLVDLSQLENSHIKILRYLDPEKYNIDLKSFILNDMPVEQA